MKKKITTAVFEPGSTTANVYGLWQYDYGQVLRIQGLHLPSMVEIHFSLQETGGTSVMRVGVTKDGVTDVIIPDSMLENDGATSDYDIFAFVYLTDATSGQTEYKIKLRVKSRPEPEVPGGGEDPDIFHEAVQAVRKSADKAAESEKQAEGWAHGREDLPERAQDNAKYYSDQTAADAKKTGTDRKEVERLVESVSGIDEQVVKVENLTKQAQTSATNAALSEQAAKTAETNAQTAQAGAETAEGNAELAERNAKVSEQAVEKAKQLVTQMGQDVLDNKNHVDQTTQAFTLTAQQAVADVNNAGQAQTERAQSVGNTAVESVKTAQTKAVEAVQTEGITQTGNVSAEGAKQVQAVQDKGEEVLQSIPEDFTAQMESKLDKNQGIENAGKALVVGEDGNVVPGDAQWSDDVNHMKLIESYAIEEGGTTFDIPVGKRYKDALLHITLSLTAAAALKVSFDDKEVLFVTSGGYLTGSNVLQLFAHDIGGYIDGGIKKISYETQTGTLYMINSVLTKGMPEMIRITVYTAKNTSMIKAGKAEVYAR